MGDKANIERYKAVRYLRTLLHEYCESLGRVVQRCDLSLAARGLGVRASTGSIKYYSELVVGIVVDYLLKLITERL